MFELEGGLLLIQSLAIAFMLSSLLPQLVRFKPSKVESP